MDKNLHDIENLFKKALEDNEEAPSQKAWDGIEKKLDKASLLSIKKKYDFLKKIAFLLLLFSTGFCLYVWKFENRNPKKQEKDISGIYEETRAKKDTFSNAPSTHEPQKTVDSFIIDNSGGITNKISSDSITANNFSNTSGQTNKITEKKVHEPLLADKLKTPIQEKDQINTKQANEVDENQISNPVSDKGAEVLNTTGISIDNNLSTNKVLNTRNIEEVKITPDNFLVTKEGLQFNSLTKIKPVLPVERTLLKKPSLKPTNQLRFAITAFYSPDISFFHYEDHDRRNSNRSDFEKSENKNFSSSFGVLFDYQFSNHYVIQSGITLSTSNFDLRPKTIYAERDNSGGIQYKLSTPLGDAFMKPSFSRNPHIGDSLFARSNSHSLQYIGIPLAIKYNFYKSKLSLNVLGGISANFLTSGKVITELEGDNNNNEIETTDKIHGLKKSYFNGLAGIGVNYNFYKNFSVCFSPTFRFALNSINNQVPVASFPNSFSFGFGLKMEL